MEKKQKSIKINFIFNIILNMGGLVFPLLTFPHVSRVLNPEGIGQANYVNSIVSYLVLIANLGVNTYGIKEGARYRDDKEQLGKFVSEMLLINLMSMIFSYLILFIIVLSPKFKVNIILLLIYGTAIFVSPFSINWFISLMEDYFYTTIRTLVIQFIGMVLTFILIRNQDDLVKYAIINAVTGMMTMFVNLKFSGKYIKLFQYKKYKLAKHIKPILLIFGSTVSATVYLNSDITILGYIKGDYVVGIYSSAVKIIKIIITFSTSLTTVLLPRIAYYKSNQFDEQYRNLLKKGADYLLMMTIPACVGVFLISDDIVKILLGKQYFDSVNVVKILAFDIVFSPLSGFISYQIVLPYNKEKIFFFSTLISCVLNVVLNLLFIPRYAQYAAAYTTLFAEVVNIMICYFATRKNVNYMECFKGMKQYVLATVAIIPVIYTIHKIITVLIISILTKILFSAGVYIGVLLKVNNEMAVYLKDSLLGRLGVVGQHNNSDV